MARKGDSLSLCIRKGILPHQQIDSHPRSSGHSRTGVPFAFFQVPWKDGKIPHGKGGGKGPGLPVPDKSINNGRDMVADMPSCKP